MTSTPGTGPYRLTGTVLPQTEPRELWIADGRIVDGPVDRAETIAEDCYVLPGLIDAHCHIGLGPQGATSDADIVAQAQSDLAAGVMMIRDCGSPADTRFVQERSDLPRLIRAGRHIARPKRYIRFAAAEVDPERLEQQVRHEARCGDGWVKLVGDWIDRAVGDLAPLWPTDIAAQAIQAAHEEGARVTAHCFDERSVAELVAAGVDCVEHGTGMSDDVISVMAERGVALVPTMINLANFPTYAAQGSEKFPRYAEHIMALHARRRDTIGKAIDAGINVYCGTDAGTVVAHGRVHDEIAELAMIGGPEFAIGAASWRGRTWLGGDNLSPGASADLIVCDSDPRENLEALRHPATKLLRGHPIG
ncbi:MAG: amidohydrolase family protein [Arachnia sp.]